MKALLDEQLSSEIAARLRHAGYDLIAVAERPDLVGSADSVLLDVATSEGRAVITNNVKDFRPLAAARLAQGQSHAGLILLPSNRSRTRSATTALASAIGDVLRDHPDGLEASERWIPSLPTS